MTVMREVSTDTILLDAIAALVSAIDGRNCSFGHSVRVASYAICIATAAGWNEPDLSRLRLGALLHDIGQIYWPDELVSKQSTPLTAEERLLIEAHTYKGAQLLEDWPSLAFVKPYVLYHQEWIDGSGYPYGLCGNAIPPEVQIVSLADVYEALRHPRRYRQRAGFSLSDVVAMMKEMRGKRWNAELFDVFATVAEQWS